MFNNHGAHIYLKITAFFSNRIRYPKRDSPYRSCFLFGEVLQLETISTDVVVDGVFFFFFCCCCFH